MPTPSSLRYAHAFIRAEYCSVVQSWGTLISRVRTCVCAHRFWSRKTIWCVIYGAGRDPIQHASPLQRHNSTLVRVDVWERACLSVCWWAYLPMQHAYMWTNRDLHTHRRILSLSHCLSLSLSLCRLLSLTHIQAGLDPFDQCLKTAKQQWDADGKGIYQTRKKICPSLSWFYFSFVFLSQRAQLSLNPPWGGGLHLRGRWVNAFSLVA